MGEGWGFLAGLLTFFILWNISRIGKRTKPNSEQQWIPVSERLPNGNEIVLLTIPEHTDDYGQEFCAGVICGHYIGGKDCEWGISDGSMVGYGLVSKKYGVEPIAWFKKPEPYQSESEG